MRYLESQLPRRGEPYTNRTEPKEYFDYQDEIKRLANNISRETANHIFHLIHSAEQSYQPATGKRAELLEDHRDDVADIFFSSTQYAEYFYQHAMGNCIEQLNNPRYVERTLRNLYPVLLREFPSLRSIFRESITKLPHGEEVIMAIQGLDDFKDLFK